MSTATVRLNKFLASSGLGSRRACDALVKSGEISVNGDVCINPGVQIGEGDEVHYGHKPVAPRQTLLILFNKPRGLVCTKNDELNRPTIFHSLPSKLHHLNHVGRLDQDSEGLILLTNDGDLANRISHPRHKTEKEYIVTLTSSFDGEVQEKLLSGVFVPELGRLKAKSIRRLSPRRLSMVLETGVKRQIREMFKALHMRVAKLVRVRIGSLTDTSLAPGKYRPLEPEEVELLMVNPTGSPRRDRTSKPSPARKQAAKKSAPGAKSGSGRRHDPKAKSGPRSSPGRKPGRSGSGNRPPKRGKR
ncbi:MAG: pseudouridine synthase [Akkermansiaceae bacterium]|nr:pseudouridine synthase [Akkermansiaceae bacterium]